MTEIMENDRIPERTAVAIGLFDGVHSGHKSILDMTVCGHGKRLEYGAEQGKKLIPAVFTFRTESVKSKHGKPFEYIFTNTQKLEKFRCCGIKYVYSPDFDEIRDMNGEEFVSEILCKKMNAGEVVCGENFRFGKNARFGAGELEAFGKKYGFDVKVIKMDGNSFSSEKFREMLREGRVNELICSKEEYSIVAEVVHGNKLGRTIDFPTINQIFAEGQLVPKKGVYLTFTVIDGKKYISVTNVGVKPTVEKNIQPLAETHILGYSGNLYGKTVEVEFFDYLREEIKFASLEELKKQIHADIAAVRKRIGETYSCESDERNDF